MNTSTIISIALGLYLIVYGLITIIKGKMLRGDFSRYTEKSVKIYSRVFGACFTASGLLFIPYWIIGYMNGNMAKITTPRLIILVGVFAFIILALVFRPIILKKDTPNTKSVYENNIDEDDV